MTVSRADSLMIRLLLVKPAAVRRRQTRRHQRAKPKTRLHCRLAFSGARCVLQYAVLPFLLPLVGVAADAAVPILLLINLAAMASIYFSLRRFWTIGYAHRWRYLVVASAALVLLAAFTAYDIVKLGAT